MNTRIHIQDYTYELPQDRIASQPLAERDSSKLLVYNKGTIEHTTFRSLSDHLPQHSFLFFNDTKVIPARILFKKDTGAEIEIFLLTPLEPGNIMAEVMMTKHSCTWQCAIGNLKRWKENHVLQKKINGILLTASLVNRSDGIVAFTWNEPLSFAEVITHAGITPLPPYIKRAVTSDDGARYQTIYSHYEGAVAAPTAGLHFSENVFASLQQRGIQKDFVTLHVSAGTFQPVKTENALEHTMHHEQLVITRQAIENLLSHNRFIVAVGTTSMRTLESIYWFGVKLLENRKSEFIISQTDPYERPELPTRVTALQAVLSYMDEHKLQTLTGTTSIFIHPGYTFKVCQALITNFHLPGTTLMLLVASFIGQDWKKVYEQALENEYRFLSFGDSSLLIPQT